MAGWTDLLNPKLYFPGILCFFSSIIAEENSPSHGKRAWYSVYKVQKKKPSTAFLSGLNFSLLSL